MSAPTELDWRHPTVDDIPAWADLLKAVEASDHTGEHFSEADLAEEFDAPHNHPDNAWFGWEPDGRLAAFGWAWALPEATELHRVHLWGAVHPELRRQGFGLQLLHWLGSRGAQIHETQAADKPGVLEVHWVDGNDGLRALLEGAGYEPLRYWFQMRCPLDGDLPDAVLPAGLGLRPFSDELSEPIRVAHNEAFRDHWGSAPRDPDSWRHGIASSTFLRGASFAALDGEDVAGYVISNHYASDAEAKGYREGWISMVGTRRPWRGRGVARALIVAAMGAYREMGFTYACLGVDAANPSGALGLYERLGFTVFHREVSYAKPI